MKIQVKSLLDLPEVARQLLSFASGEKIFVFEGDMGAGKTTFIKAFCQILGVDDVVSSPTYSIVNEYAHAETPIYHFDFYRIKDIQEAYDLGYEEYFYSNSICLIEWPEKVEELLPRHFVKVEIELQEENERTFTFSKAG